MTVKELKERLEKVPDDLEVCCTTLDWDGEYDIPTLIRGIVVSTNVRNSTDEYLDEDYLEKRNSNVLIIRGCSFWYLNNEKGLDE